MTTKKWAVPLHLPSHENGYGKGLKTNKANELEA